MKQALREQRRAKQISLEQIADSTKISLFFLQAIETEQFEKLPGGVFDRSYIRQYAAAAGMAEQQLMERYQTWQDERQRAEAEPENRRKSGSFALRWLASLFALLLRAG